MDNIHKDESSYIQPRKLLTKISRPYKKISSKNGNDAETCPGRASQITFQHELNWLVLRKVTLS